MTPRICQIGLDVVLQSGGTTRAIADIHEALGGSIVSFSDPSLAPHYPTPDVIRVLHGSGPWARRYAYAAPKATRTAEAAVAGAEVVVIHSLYRYHFDWAVRLCRKLRRPYVVVPHGTLDPWVFTYRGLQKRAWLALSGRAAIEQADLVLFVTRRERDKAAQWLTAQRSEVLPFPVPLQPPRTADREAARRQRGYGTADRVFLLFGRLHPAKRPLEVLRAFAHARAHAANARLLVVGPDTAELSRGDCERAARELGAQDVRFEPAAYGDDKRAVLACADVLVNYSWKENFGYALCEALSAGMPAILSAGNDLGADLAATGCAWHLADGDDALAGGLIDACRLPAQAVHDMGARGREWCRRELSSDRFRGRLLELLAGLGRR